MKTSVYWIRHKEYTDIFSQGYVGVSTDTVSRFERHAKYSENNHLKRAIAKHGWDNLVKETIIIGENQYCYDLEAKLRQKKNIGWNIAEGGNKPPVSQYRGDDYVSPLKGIPRPTPWMAGRKVSANTCEIISEQRKVKVKYLGDVYSSFEHLAEFLGIKYSTLTNRIYRNAKKYGYEVLK